MLYANEFTPGIYSRTKDYPRRNKIKKQAITSKQVKTLQLVVCFNDHYSKMKLKGHFSADVAVRYIKVELNDCFH